jgi:O-antigen/teichoic acid export membrane protein
MHFKTILINSVSLLGADILSKFISFIFFAVLARYLPTHDIGIYITLLTFMSIGVFFSDPGISQALVRNIAIDRCKGVRDLNNSLMLTGLASFVAWAVILILVYVLNYPDTLFYLLAFAGIALTLQAWSQIASAFIKALQRMEIVALGYSASSAIFALLGIIMLLMNFGLTELTVLLVVQGLFNLTFFWLAASRLGLPFPRPRWNLPETTIFIKEVIPIALMAGSAIALENIDIMMLSNMKSMSDTAEYGFAVKIIASLSLISGCILTVLFPLFSSQWENARSQMIIACKYAMKFFLIIGLFSTAVITVLSRELINLCYGNQFLGSSNALVILVWSFLLYMLAAPLGILILIDKERVRHFIPYAFGVVILNVLLNILLIPTYSYIGASISTVVCSIVLFVIKVRFMGHIIQTCKVLYSIGFKPLIATIVMIIVLLVTKPMGLFLSFAFGVIAFVITLWLLGEFHSEEYSALGLKIHQKLK